jgi:hypothetical protein
MPRRAQGTSCSVPSCQGEWIAAQVGKFCFCEDHALGAKAAYQQYKETTTQALANFDAGLLIKAAAQREDYSLQYVRKSNQGHDAFVELLRQLARLPWPRRAEVWSQWQAR